MMPYHRHEGPHRGVVPEIGGHIADDNPLVRIGLCAWKPPARELGADRDPPALSNGLMNGKIRVRDKIQRENLLQDRLFEIRLDRQRPVEMRDRSIDLA